MHIERLSDGLNCSDMSRVQVDSAFSAAETVGAELQFTEIRVCGARESKTHSRNSACEKKLPHSRLSAQRTAGAAVRARRRPGSRRTTDDVPPLVYGQDK